MFDSVFNISLPLKEGKVPLHLSEFCATSSVWSGAAKTAKTRAAITDDAINNFSKMTQIKKIQIQTSDKD